MENIKLEYKYADFYQCDITKVLDQACGEKEEHGLCMFVGCGNFHFHIYSSERNIGTIWLDDNWVIEYIYINYDLIGFYGADINAKLQQFVGEVIVFE
ncbi:hypothetical protein [Eubacterium ramulus]|uniref:hypothetical protein n=1 Tax=Eubacterium ramulus TaxID=39490 RepID=UPI0039999C9C